MVLVQNSRGEGGIWDVHQATDVGVQALAEKVASYRFLSSCVLWHSNNYTPEEKAALVKFDATWHHFQAQLDTTKTYQTKTKDFNP